MVINRENMDALFDTFNTAFTKGMKRAGERASDVDILLDELATVIPATGAATTHAWLGQIHGMREWLGERLIRNLVMEKLRVVNRKFENTVAVGRDDIEDDAYGTFTPLIEMLGDSSAAIWRQLAIDALVTNGLWADGKAFFCSGRTLGGGSTITNAVTTALARAAFESAIEAMRSWTLHGGEPAEVRPMYLLVGPKLETTAWHIVEDSKVASDGVALDNPNKGKVRLRTDPRLVGDYEDLWFILGQKNGIKPVAIQRRRVPTLTRMDKDEADNVFFREEYYYGTSARGEGFCTLPFLAYCGGLESVSSAAEPPAPAAAPAPEPAVEPAPRASGKRAKSDDPPK